MTFWREIAPKNLPYVITGFFVFFIVTLKYFKDKKKS